MPSHRIHDGSQGSRFKDEIGNWGNIEAPTARRGSILNSQASHTNSMIQQSKELDEGSRESYDFNRTTTLNLVVNEAFGNQDLNTDPKTKVALKKRVHRRHK